MAGCDVLYHDPAHASSGDGWRPCSAPGQVWTDPEQVLRVRLPCPPPPAHRPPRRWVGRPDPLGPARPGDRPRPLHRGLGGVVKLVRDRILELAAASGRPGTFHQATEAEFARWLRAKLLEEAQEAATARPAGLVEELGDVLQVLYALAELAGCAAAEIECARVRKARTHGTYTRRILWHPPTTT